MEGREVWRGFDLHRRSDFMVVGNPSIRNRNPTPNHRGREREREVSGVYIYIYIYACVCVCMGDCVWRLRREERIFVWGREMEEGDDECELEEMGSF